MKQIMWIFKIVNWNKVENSEKIRVEELINQQEKQKIEGNLKSA